MKNLNQWLSIVVIVFLFSSFFLIGCSEWNREMMFPDLDLPDSVTVMIQDIPEGAAFKLSISTDYTKYTSTFGNSRTIHHYNEKYGVTENFNKTFELETEEPTLALDLICTHLGTTSEDESNSIRLIVRFNGDGNFDKGNHNDLHPIEVGTTIHLLSAFSRYEGTSRYASRITDLSGPFPYE